LDTNRILTVCIEVAGSIDDAQLKGWFATLFWEGGENRPVILRVKGMASVIDTNEKYIIQGITALLIEIFCY
jgi:hypothetical protein